MTTAIPLPAPGRYWDRVTVDGRPWWIPDESPGGLGDPEIWADETAIDMYARGDAAPAVTVRLSSSADGPSLYGAIVRFERHREDLYPPVAYRITCRRWSTCNAGRPYYVLRWPDGSSLSSDQRPRERLMVQTPPAAPEGETRGGDRPDWAKVTPGEPLPEIIPETSLPPDDEGGQ